jgi:hypothetical protein
MTGNQDPRTIVTRLYDEGENDFYGDSCDMTDVAEGQHWRNAPRGFRLPRRYINSSTRFANATTPLYMPFRPRCFLLKEKPEIVDVNAALIIHEEVQDQRNRWRLVRKAREEVLRLKNC